MGTLSADHFVIAANNLALDANDYFIFNTTDQTLWFDRDGSGAREALIVADLQSGAVLTAADIWLV
ncbi:MAG: hemolysin-type calcium-binding repeat family protein [uncultured bacterium]|nr:MAG: hemolysin-type calcium-binding repeat family protein [uncultured bacterium]